MEQQTFNPKDFLGASVLSPLESIEIKGGMADDAISVTVTVEVSTKTVTVSVTP